MSDIIAFRLRNWGFKSALCPLDKWLSLSWTSQTRFYHTFMFSEIWFGVKGCDLFSYCCVLCVIFAFVTRERSLRRLFVWHSQLKERVLLPSFSNKYTFLAPLMFRYFVGINYHICVFDICKWITQEFHMNYKTSISL